MLTMFRDGGYSMFFVVGFGLTALLWAAWYAIRGKKRPLGFVVAMMVATFFAITSGICADLGMMGKTLAGAEEEPGRQAMAADKEHRVDYLLEGFAESMAPGIMGFSLLSLTALLLAVGQSRASAAGERERAGLEREA
jgi:hypothetical protein